MSVEENIGTVKREKAKKPCITNEMIDKMKERKKLKNVNTPGG